MPEKTKGAELQHPSSCKYFWTPVGGPLSTANSHLNVFGRGPRTVDCRLLYIRKLIKIPAATAEPITPATLGAIAWVNR